MSIFALLLFIAAAVLAIVESRRAWWVPVLIIAGIAIALIVTTGTQVTVH
jgi:hypothetical protein